MHQSDRKFFCGIVLVHRQLSTRAMLSQPENCVAMTGLVKEEDEERFLWWLPPAPCFSVAPVSIYICCFLHEHLHLTICRHSAKLFTGPNFRGLDAKHNS